MPLLPRNPALEPGAAGNAVGEKKERPPAGHRRRSLEVNVHLDEMRRFWAQTLGISGPQWTILTALAALDRGQGVPVKDLVAMLHVQQPFVTTQTKMLENSGFVRRTTSSDDGRVVLMSLSDKARKQIAHLSSRQEVLDKFIFADFDDRTLKDIADQIASLKDRLEKLP